MVFHSLFPPFFPLRSSTRRKRSLGGWIVHKTLIRKLAGPRCFFFLSFPFRHAEKAKGQFAKIMSDLRRKQIGRRLTTFPPFPPISPTGLRSQTFCSASFAEIATKLYLHQSAPPFFPPPVPPFLLSLFPLGGRSAISGSGMLRMAGPLGLQKDKFAVFFFPPFPFSPFFLLLLFMTRYRKGGQ